MAKRKFDESKVKRGPDGRFVASAAGTSTRFGRNNPNMSWGTAPKPVVQRPGESNAAFQRRVRKRIGMP